MDQVLETVAAKDLWIADRNFCTTDFLFGIARRGGSFLIRQHASTLYCTLVGKRKARGRIETGAVFEQTLRATNEAGESCSCGASRWSWTSRRGTATPRSTC